MSSLTLLVFAVLIFAVLEAPIFCVLAAVSAVLLYSVEHDAASLQLIVIEMNRMASMPVLIALPIFTFVGVLLTETRAPQRMMDLMRALFGWLPGGIAIAAVCACAFFTAITGASGVTIVALGSLLYPILRSQEYGQSFSLGLLTASGSLGLLFPPSLPAILYGVVARVDIGQIFKAAFLPGTLRILALAVVVAIYRYPKRDNALEKSDPRPSYGRRVWQALVKGIWDWPVVVIILAGIYGGLATVTEVSALVAVYVVVVECFILKEIRFNSQLPGIIVQSAMLSGAILVIFVFALGFTGFLVDEQIPNRILDYLTGLTSNKYLFLAGLNIFLLGVGCLMDIFSAIVIVVPIMVPIALKYGVDPIHLCVIFLVNLEIGYLTPPIGMNLFISSLKFKKPVTQLYRASLPYLLILLVMLILITYVPILSVWTIKG